MSSGKIGGKTKEGQSCDYRENPSSKKHTQSFLALAREPDWPRQKEDAEQMRGPLCKIEEHNPHVKKKVVRN